MTFDQKISEEIFFKKYALHGETTAEQVFSGVAKEIASVEEPELQSFWAQKFEEEISSGRLLPGGRILANARPESKLKNYNNCFTIDIEDSMEGIYNSLYEDAIISKSGGGVGFNVSKIRPKGDKLSKGGEASGPISFLRVFNESAKIIMTGGQRRSAHICIMNIDHPDIEEFITVKQGSNNNELTQFNISVGITNEFMHQVEIDGSWDLKWEGKVYKTIKAKYLYDLLADNAYKHNEPGVLFLDTVEKYNNGYWAFKMDRCNPCGEITMPSYSLCCLASLNLLKYVQNPFEDTATFDYDSFAKSIAIAVRFLDNVLDVTDYPLEKIKTFSKGWRRIGLGFTGLADTFAMMSIVYGSPESIELSKKIATVLRDESYTSSILLAKEKGSFPQCNIAKLLEAEFIKTLPDSIKLGIANYGLRNIGLNTCAPTGTISLSLGQNCSSGIEPIFSLSYDRNIRTGRGDETVKEHVYDYAWLQYLEWAKVKYNESDENKLPTNPVFITTQNIDPYKAIDVQATFQMYIDHSISKTCNLPSAYSFDDYTKLWMYAYKQGLKGFTSFNPEGSVKGILEVKKDEETKENRPPTIDRHYAPKRPEMIPCDIHEITFEKEKYIAAIGTYFGSLYEVFLVKNEESKIDTNKHKQGFIKKISKGRYDLILKNGEERTLIEDIGKYSGDIYGSLSRMVSMAMRHGTPLEFIVETLQKSSGFNSFEKIVARVLKKYIRDGEKVLSSAACPNCGSTKLVYQEGCQKCLSCSWSRCS